MEVRTLGRARQRSPPAADARAARRPARAAAPAQRMTVHSRAGGGGREAATVATIAPVVGSAERPLWSVMIPTYDCARFLDQTLRSVLAQDPGPAAMQIEVVDDHSLRDHPAEVVARVGGGR